MISCRRQEIILKPRRGHQVGRRGPRHIRDDNVWRQAHGIGAGRDVRQYYMTLQGRREGNLYIPDPMASHKRIVDLDIFVDTSYMGAEVVGSSPELVFLGALAESAPPPIAIRIQQGMHALFMPLEIIGGAESLLAPAALYVASEGFSMLEYMFPTAAD